ncbi:MAG: nitrous oxide reductase accessory protein NosL [Phycisphaerales bacterium]
MFLPACSGHHPDAPPKITYGQSPCDECRMIISDQAYAAAVIGEGDDGPNTAYRFDDIGCMIHFMQSHRDAHIVHVWVHDQKSAQWLDALHATFVQSDQLHTPMASGLAAFADPQQAAKDAQILRGKTMRWAQLIALNASTPTTKSACECCDQSE